MGMYEHFKSQRWICFIAALIICVCAGFGYSWSVLQGPIAQKFGWNEGAVSLTFTITVVCSTMSPLFFGSVIQKITTRRCVLIGGILFGTGLVLSGIMTSLWQLYAFYGVLSGLGCGFVYPSLMAYVVKLFPDKAGLASGLGTAAYGSGAIIWAPTAAAIIGRTSIGTALIALGVVFLVIILVGDLFLKEVPDEWQSLMTQGGTHTGDEKTGLKRSEMLKTSAFYITALTFTFGLIAGIMVISQASPILQTTVGFSPESASIFVSVFAACNMAGRFIFGSVSDKIGMQRTMAVVFILCAASMAMLAVGTNAICIIAAMGVAASCYGGFASVLTPLTAEVFGSKYITENYGAMYIVFGIASLIGPVMASYFKASGSYAGAFIASAALALLGLLLSRFIKKQVGQKCA